MKEHLKRAFAGLATIAVLVLVAKCFVWAIVNHGALLGALVAYLLAGLATYGFGCVMLDTYRLLRWSRREDR